jgi:hypothetical protein
MVSKALGAVAATAAVAGTAKSLLSGGGIGNLFSTPTGLPSPNILSNYASYNYIIGLSALSVEDINYPDISYKAGKILPLICKSGSIDPENRINTKFGKWDFFIDNLNFESLIGKPDAKKTNVTTVQFDVYEPYSIGVFMSALQQAARTAGWKNWRDAPYLLSIEFRGAKETGQMVNIPFTTRHIPIRLTTIQTRANEQGCRYMVNSFATQGQALTTQYANLKTDAAIKGKTIQEVLQTGEQSLQAVVNQTLQAYKAKGVVDVPDQIVILFPKTIASAPPSAGPKPNKAATATIAPKLVSSADEIGKKIGVSLSPVNKTLVQAPETVNDIGLSSMGYTAARPGDQSAPNETEVYVPASKSWSRGSMVVDPENGTLKFSQDMDIPSVIDQVLLTSDYPGKALETDNVDEDGMRKWWRVDTQVYYIKTEENLIKTGNYPRIIVYRVIEYLAHSGAITATNSPPPGYERMKKTAVKQYDYLYTGKNSEVIKFEIDFSVGFANQLASDAYDSVDDNTNNEAQTDKTAKIAPLPDGKPPSNETGAIGTSGVRNDKTEDAKARHGGGGPDTVRQRAGRVFYNALKNEIDMVALSMDIMGDPFWIVNSGQGNYTATQAKIGGVTIKDLNTDGSVAWQNGEVHVLINFRSPFDINQTTGLYDFKSANLFDLGGSTKTSPVIGFTGLYRINIVSSSFRNGVFRQTLKGNRYPLSELAGGVAANTFNSNTPAPSAGESE